MIGIFNNKTTKTDLTLYNGEYILDSICTKFEVTEELNGEYSLDIIFKIDNSIDKKAYDLMANDSLLKVDEEYGIEYFRIAKVIKNKRNYEIFARHITISETLKLFCEDVRPTNLNGAGAISWIYNNSRGLKWLTVGSNITTTNTAYFIRKSVYEALFSADNSFINKWGGEIYRRGFNLQINSKVGQDRGVSIRSGKNLKGIEEKTNIDNLITSIYPVGFDGITIAEKFINSDYINNYSSIYPMEVKFDDVKVKDENNEEGFDTLEEAQEELRKRAKELFNKDKVDILTASYTLDFAELEKAEGYKEYSIVEKTWLGDIVNVYEETLDIDLKLRVTKRVYDGLKKKRKITTLSNKNLNIKPPSLNQVIEKLEKVDSTDNVLSLAKLQATALIKSGMKNSYVIVKENELLIMDTKDINTATKVWRFNNAGLGYSSTGYLGEYGLAMTQDGSIVADFITTGVLNAVIIKTGLLSSFNNSTWINMDNGNFNFANKIKFDGENFSIGDDISNVTIKDDSLKVKNGAIEVLNGEGEILLKGVSSGLLLKDNSIKIKSDLTTNLGEGLELTKRGIKFVGEDGESASVFYGLYDDSCWYLTSSLAGINDIIFNIDKSARITRLISDFIETNQLKATTLNLKEGISVGSGGTINGTLNTRKINTQGYNVDLEEGTLYGNVEGGEITGDIYIYRDGITRPAVRGNGRSDDEQVNGIAIRSGSTGTYLEVQTMDLTAYGVNVNPSDENLKENILQIDNEERNKAIEIIKKIKHYSYDFKDHYKYGEGAKCGYIAQELKEVDENFVFGVEQSEGETIYYPNFNNIIPYITLALKEENKKIEQQAEYIRLLEKKIENLEERIK